VDLDQQALEAQNRQFADRVAQVNSDLGLQQQEMETVAEEMQSSLGDATADLNGQIEDLEKRLGDIVSNVALQAEETQGELDRAYAQLGDLEGRLALLQTAQDLVKVRLLLLEENPGTARNDTGSGYGVELSPEDRERWFKREWSSVVLHIEGGDEIEVNVSPSFWRGCPELRHKGIGQFLVAKGLAPWKDRKRPRPRVRLEPLGGGHLRLFRSLMHSTRSV
jgi:hypothetical protein